MTAGFQTNDGFATLGPELVEIRALLEKRFLRWASECGAEAMLFPPLVPVRDLEALDYFKNFPHLALFADRIHSDRLKEYAEGRTLDGIEKDLVPSGYALPSAACYGVYLSRRGTRLNGPKKITTIASCFRNEREYVGLSRLRGFSMREIVCLGSTDEVKSHLAWFKEKIEEFCRALALPVSVQAATDPFFEPSTGRALMQKLFPVKEEFVYGGSVAIASLNFHRNFFGERCLITGTDDQPVSTGCAAFGIERWMHALSDRFGSAMEALRALRMHR